VSELFPWQREAAAAALAARARWPHGLLLEGPRGIGKRDLALHFARALLCESPLSDGAPCGRCASCGYVDAGAHPDLRLIEPIERDEEGNERPVEEIVVDRVRELIEFTQLSTHRQRSKVAIIIPAERMNAAAANALLKTLEEPPPATYLMLVAHHPSQLRETLVSRCRRLVAPQPERAAAAAWLAQQGAAQPELLLAQAGGAPLLAAALADPAVQREREVLIDALSRPQLFSPVALGARIDVCRKDERKAVLADVVYWLTTWVADLATSMNGGAPRFHPDRADALARLAVQVARLSLFRYYQELLRQRGLLGHPLTPRLVAEAMLFEYQGLFTKADGEQR
jgi:DNA polymerase-3 subunit delta'